MDEKKLLKKILLISWSIPPDTSGSAIIVNNLSLQFSNEEMIIAGEKPYNKPKVYRGTDKPEIYHVTYALPSGLRGERWFRKIQLPFALVKLLFLCIANKCETILVVYPKKEFLLLGYLVSLLTDKPLICYFHNTYLENEAGVYRKKLAGFLQKKCFDHAKHIYVMSDGMRDLYSVNYPKYINKISSLVHTFNEEIPDKINSYTIKEPVHFLFSGNINESCRDAAVRLFKVITSNPGYRLTLLSNIDKQTLQTWGINTENITINLVSRNELMDKLHDADFLLLPHGFHGGLSDTEYKTIFPTKTIEYLISQKPIIACLPLDTFLCEFLRTNNCAKLITAQDENTIKKEISNFIKDTSAHIEIVNNALKTSTMFTAKFVVEKLRSNMMMIDKYK